MRIADAANEAASIKKAASRPTAAATSPPQGDPERALAVGRSRSSTRFGSAADEAGSKTAEKDVRAASTGNMIQTVLSSRMSRKPRQSTARTTSQSTMSFRRSRRSAGAPAKGETRKDGTALAAEG